MGPVAFLRVGGCVGCEGGIPSEGGGVVLGAVEVGAVEDGGLEGRVGGELGGRLGGGG